MDLGGFNWSMITIVGAAILGVVVLYATLRNRVSNQTRDESEAATHRLYQEEDRDHRGEGDGAP